MRTVRTGLVLVLALLIAAPLLAGEKKGKKAPKPAPCPAKAFADRMLKDITLTDEQKAKLGELCKEFGPKLAALNKEKMGILTDEQKKARSAAEKEAKAAGKKGKEMYDAVNAAVKLTDDQKEKTDKINKESAALNKELGGKIRDFLTDDQKAQLKAKAGKKK